MLHLRREVGKDIESLTKDLTSKLSHEK